jgi:hypothetical protein
VGQEIHGPVLFVASDVRHTELHQVAMTKVNTVSSQSH